MTLQVDGINAMGVVLVLVSLNVFVIYLIINTVSTIVENQKKREKNKARSARH